MDIAELENACFSLTSSNPDHEELKNAESTINQFKEQPLTVEEIIDLFNATLDQSSSSIEFMRSVIVSCLQKHIFFQSNCIYEDVKKIYLWIFQGFTEKNFSDHVNSEMFKIFASATKILFMSQHKSSILCHISELTQKITLLNLQSMKIIQMFMTMLDVFKTPLSYFKLGLSIHQHTIIALQFRNECMPDILSKTVDSFKLCLQSESEKQTTERNSNHIKIITDLLNRCFFWAVSDQSLSEEMIYIDYKSEKLKSYNVIPYVWFKKLFLTDFIPLVSLAIRNLADSDVVFNTLMKLLYHLCSRYEIIGINDVSDQDLNSLFLDSAFNCLQVLVEIMCITKNYSQHASILSEILVSFVTNVDELIATILVRDDIILLNKIFIFTNFAIQNSISERKKYNHETYYIKTTENIFLFWSDLLVTLERMNRSQPPLNISENMLQSLKQITLEITKCFIDYKLIHPIGYDGLESFELESLSLPLDGKKSVSKFEDFDSGYVTILNLACCGRYSFQPSLAMMMEKLMSCLMLCTQSPPTDHLVQFYNIYNLIQMIILMIFDDSEPSMIRLSDSFLNSIHPGLKGQYESSFILTEEMFNQATNLLCNESSSIKNIFNLPMENFNPAILSLLIIPPLYVLFGKQIVNYHQLSTTNHVGISLITHIIQTLIQFLEQYYQCFLISKYKYTKYPLICSNFNIRSIPFLRQMHQIQSISFQMLCNHSCSGIPKESCSALVLLIHQSICLKIDLKSLSRINSSKETLLPIIIEDVFKYCKYFFTEDEGATEDIVLCLSSIIYQYRGDMPNSLELINFTLSFFENQCLSLQQQKIQNCESLFYEKRFNMILSALHGWADPLFSKTIGTPDFQSFNFISISHFDTFLKRLFILGEAFAEFPLANIYILKVIEPVTKSLLQFFIQPEKMFMMNPTLITTEQVFENINSQFIIIVTYLQNLIESMIRYKNSECSSNNTFTHDNYAQMTNLILSQLYHTFKMQHCFPSRLMELYMHCFFNISEFTYRLMWRGIYEIFDNYCVTCIALHKNLSLKPTYITSCDIYSPMARCIFFHYAKFQNDLSDKFWMLVEVLCETYINSMYDGFFINFLVDQLSTVDQLVRPLLTLFPTTKSLFSHLSKLLMKLFIALREQKRNGIFLIKILQEVENIPECNDLPIQQRFPVICSITAGSILNKSSSSIAYLEVNNLLHMYRQHVLSQ